MHNKLLNKKSEKIREMTLGMIAHAGSGHPGSSLSIVDILVCLHYKSMNINYSNPLIFQDYLILSKGHGVPALYSILIDKGIVDSDEVYCLRKFGSPLQGHPDIRFLPQLNVSSGSLGQGLSIGVGIAYARLKNKINSRVFVILGDGECQEGQIWEAAMLAAHLKANNLCVIIDYNKIQHDGFISETLKIEPLSKKWESFGWEVVELDGHNHGSIIEGLKITSDKPKVLIAHTVKGKGVDYMENDYRWHSVYDASRMVKDFCN